MKLFKHAALLILICLLSIPLKAQEKQQTESIDEGSINDQFEFVIRKSSNWKDQKGQSYKVIKQNIIFTLKEHVLDSLHAIHAALNDANGMIKNQKLEINRLTTELGQVQDELEKTQKEKDSMSLLGQQLKKSSYRKITWAVIGILLALLLTFIVKYKSSSAITLSTEKKLSDLENEYADHRRISLEREQKIKRQLQDEINKGIA